MRLRALVTLTPQTRQQAAQGVKVDAFAHSIGSIQAVIQRQIFRLLAQKTVLSADDDEMAFEPKRLEMRQGFNSVHFGHAKVEREHVRLDAAQYAVERGDLYQTDGV